jgi:hypothetical protein
MVEADLSGKPALLCRASPPGVPPTRKALASARVGVYDGPSMKVRTTLFALIASCLLAPAELAALPETSTDPLIGTWVSTEPILVHIKFSLTFEGPEYRVDCTLGQTIGTWVASQDHIFFTPVKVGINSGDVGKSDTWAYRFVDPDTVPLSCGPISVQLFRRR